MPHLPPLPVGANVVPEGVRFRLWAPGHPSVSVCCDGATHPLLRESESGYFSATVRNLTAGAKYRYVLEGRALPDPASRFQPEGPHGPSQVIDPSTFRWTDMAWKGVALQDAVVYEMHIGTFTPEGTWAAAAERLPHLRDLGVTVLEVMPVADFSGRYGWGYDGVNLFAPTRLYGTPDDMRSFVNRAHDEGIAVILDVVYNHLGADGNYLGEFTKDYFSRKHTTDWGDAINFDGPNSQPVREFFLANAAYWIREFHIDGLRVDATQNIYDDGEPHIMAELSDAVRAAAGPNRHTLIIGENEPQNCRFLRSRSAGGYGFDALWNDDLHHSACVALTGHNDAYYTDYKGTPQEFVSAFKYGYLFQGQRYKWQKKRRGSSTRDLAPSAFVTFIENHDQVANSARGDRMPRLTTPGRLKAMTTAILLGPGTPMLFQGQEFASSRQFRYFADVPEPLASLVQEGRREFMSQWRTISGTEMLACLGNPCSPETFVLSKLDWDDARRNASMLRLHRDLLRLRHNDPAFSRWRRGAFDGAVIGPEAFLLRAFAENVEDRLIIVNLGPDLHLDPAPEPLLAPPDGMRWSILLSTEHPDYGGCGTAPPDTEENWRIPGHAALVLKARPATEEEDA